MKIRLRFAAGLLVPALVFASPADAQTGWSDRIELSGDFRLRWETIDAEGSANRERARFRARFGIETQASNDLRLVFRLATGDGSPVSRNLTMDSGFSAKEILVDRAYVDWRLNDAWRVNAGKVGRPWFRAGGTQLVWDNDLTPEGIAVLYRDGGLFGSAGAFVVEERSTADDSLLLTLQAGLSHDIGDGAKLTAGVSYYGYTEAEGNLPFYDGDPRGNRVDAAGNYLSDFRLVELFAEYKSQLGDLPVTVYADVVQNTGADDEDLAYAIGANLGRAADRGTWQVGYAWQDTEADAVVGAFSDSNFGGADTDSRGHLLRSSYALRDNVRLGGTLFVNERGMTTGNTLDYDRIMFDIQFSFE